MITYLDTSAVAKLLLDEPGSDLADRVWDSSGQRVSSLLVLVETGSVIARIGRSMRLPPHSRRRLAEAWDERRRHIGTLEVSPDVVDLAVDLTHRHPLSGADAVHLASALVLDIDDVVLVTWDARLHAAALAEGLAVAPGSLTG